MTTNKLIILGGGASVKEGIHKGLFDLIPNTFSVGLNFAYRYVNTTVNCGVDEKFYNDNKNDLDKLPLYIGKEHIELGPRGNNTIFLPPHNNYYRDLKPGIYSSTLVGLFTLSLFINLIDEGEIYLLGYDYGPLRDHEGQIVKDNTRNVYFPDGKPITHWYQGEIEHRGIGKINWYTSTVLENKISGKRISHAEKEFRVYKDESKVKIFNVGSNSAIDIFPKISYNEFFNRNLITDQNQDDIRLEVKKRIKVLQGDMAYFRQNPPVYTTNNINIENVKGPFEV